MARPRMPVTFGVVVMRFQPGDIFSQIRRLGRDELARALAIFPRSAMT